MTLNGKALAKALGGSEITVHHHLCRAQLEEFERAAEGGSPLVVACTQEAPLFQETLDGMDSAPPARFANIREHAGWSADGKKAAPKIAALLAEAALDLEPTTVVTMKSEGSLLVIGSDEAALEAAAQVAGRLDVTVLLTGEDMDLLPPPDHGRSRLQRRRQGGHGSSRRLPGGGGGLRPRQAFGEGGHYLRRRCPGRGVGLRPDPRLAPPARPCSRPRKSATATSTPIPATRPVCNAPCWCSPTWWASSRSPAT